MSNNGPRYQTRQTTGDYRGADVYVVDTMQLNTWNYPLAVADCPDLATAEKIALALNRTADA